MENQPEEKPNFKNQRDVTEEETEKLQDSQDKRGLFALQRWIANPDPFREERQYRN